MAAGNRERSPLSKFWMAWAAGKKGAEVHALVACGGCWFGGMLVWWHVEGAEVHALVACGGCLFGGMWRDWWHVEGVKGLVACGGCEGIGGMWRDGGMWRV